MKATKIADRDLSTRDLLHLSDDAILRLKAFTPKHKIRFVTATSLFDGHDASINIMRRLLQARGPK